MDKGLNSLFVNAPKFYHIKSWFSWFFRNIKWARQRIKKGYCDLDVWNFCDFHSFICAGALKELRDTGHGVPNTIFEEADGDEDKAIKLWHDYLTYLIERFEFISKPENEKPSFAYWNQYMDISQKEDKDSLFPHSNSEAAIKAKEIWKNAYKEEDDEEEKAIQEVFAALPKYYRSLWD